MYRHIFYKINVAVIALFIVFGTGTAYAAGPGISPGTEIPHQLSLEDYTGKERSFDGMKGENGLALFFVRSVVWCPYCKNQLADLGKRTDEFRDFGYNVAVISYEEQAAQKPYMEEAGHDFVLLSDPRSEAIRAFGLFNEAMQVGTFAYGIPHPAVYIIDENGVITHKFAEQDYKDRPALDTVLDAIRPEPEAAEPAPEPEPASEPEAGPDTADEGEPAVTPAAAKPEPEEQALPADTMPAQE